MQINETYIQHMNIMIPVISIQQPDEGSVYRKQTCNLNKKNKQSEYHHDINKIAVFLTIQ